MKHETLVTLLKVKLDNAAVHVEALTKHIGILKAENEALQEELRQMKSSEFTKDKCVPN